MGVKGGAETLATILRTFENLKVQIRISDFIKNMAIKKMIRSLQKASKHLDTD
jgi:hypothetical protein